MDIEFLKQNGVDVNKSLELFGDMEIYNETFQDYLDGIEEKENNLKRSLDIANWDDYAIFAHSIKSDARYLGFTHTAEIALSHEMAGKEGNQHFILKNYDDFLEEVEKMTSIVKRYLNGEKANTEVINQANNEMPNNETLKEVIVIADDSKLVGNFASRILANTYDIITTFDGKETIDLINSGKYKVLALLLDLNMPNIGGFEVLEYLKNNNLLEKIPVSIITGEDSKDMINKAFTYHIVDMLVKPFSNQDLLRVVEKTINFNK